MEKLLILTSRLEIRNLKSADLNGFHTYRSNPEVTKYQGFEVMTFAQSEAFISEQSRKTFGQPGQWVQFGIADKITGDILGDCAIRLDQHDIRIAETGITISHLHQRKGYAKEALLGIMAFLFDNRQVHRVVATVDAENVASVNLFRSLGFRQEAHFIENIFFKGAWGSEYQFAMLEKQWVLSDHKKTSCQ